MSPADEIASIPALAANEPHRLSEQQQQLNGDDKQALRSTESFAADSSDDDIAKRDVEAQDAVLDDDHDQGGFVQRAYKPGGIVDTFLGRNGAITATPPLVWSKGARAFLESLGRKTRAIFTLRFMVALFLGQCLSLCITGTSTITTELGNHGWSMPTFQSFFVYAVLAFVYTPLTLYKYGFRAWGRMVVRDGWKYFILAAFDVEANFCVVKAYQYTDLLSAMLLDSWATPACMIVAFFLVKARYHWTQIVAVLVAILGLGLCVLSDVLTDKNWEPTNKAFGDGMMLLGATFYGVSNALEERLVRRRPLYEVVGQLGLYGMIINGIQGGALEHELFHTVEWNGTTIGYLIGFTACMLFLYTTAPILFRLSSSPFYNINLLTSDFFGLLIGIKVFDYSPFWLYFVAFALVILGLVVYFSVQRPEGTAALEVKSRGRQQAKEEAAGRARVAGA